MAATMKRQRAGFPMPCGKPSPVFHAFDDGDEPTQPDFVARLKVPPEWWAELDAELYQHGGGAIGGKR